MRAPIIPRAKSRSTCCPLQVFATPSVLQAACECPESHVQTFMKHLSLLNESAHGSSSRDAESFGTCQSQTAATLIILSAPPPPQSPPRKAKPVFCGPPGQPRLKILRWTSVSVMRPASHAWEVPPAAVSEPGVAESAASFECQSRSMLAFTESDPEASPARRVEPPSGVASPESRSNRKASIGCTGQGSVLMIARTAVEGASGRGGACSGEAGRNSGDVSFTGRTVSRPRAMIPVLLL
mmetsp:Transcript_45220/g.146941  ORF Transcript_45220/g.146941 Transcript_45220/m.146941 type:complete len:239 (+) Transcript_45220:837-1553(+)